MAGSSVSVGLGLVHFLKKIHGATFRRLLLLVGSAMAQSQIKEANEHLKLLTLTLIEKDKQISALQEQVRREQQRAHHLQTVVSTRDEQVIIDCVVLIVSYTHADSAPPSFLCPQISSLSTQLSEANTQLATATAHVSTLTTETRDLYTRLSTLNRALTELVPVADLSRPWRPSGPVTDLDDHATDEAAALGAIGATAGAGTGVMGSISPIQLRDTHSSFRANISVAHAHSASFTIDDDGF